MEPLQVKTDRDGDVIAVSATGELDIATAGRLDEELRRVDELGPKLLVLDLRGLAFLDSTGIRTILAADARAQEAGTGLKIIRARGGGPGLPPHRHRRPPRHRRRILRAVRSSRAINAAYCRP